MDAPLGAKGTHLGLGGALHWQPGPVGGLVGRLVGAGAGIHDADPAGGLVCREPLAGPAGGRDQPGKRRPAWCPSPGCCTNAAVAG